MTANTGPEATTLADATSTTGGDKAAAHHRPPFWFRTARWWVVVILVPLIGGVGAAAKSVIDEWRHVEADRTAERRAEQELELRVYEYAVSALDKGDANHQLLAVTLVEELMVANQPLRTKLLAVLRAQGKGDVPKVAAFVSDDPAAESPARVIAQGRADSGDANWKPFRYDLFYCETSGTGARSEAEAFAAKMHEKQVTGQIRVRPLPAAVNERPGYSVEGYEVRPEETEMAAANAMLKAMGAADKMQIKEAGTRTPNYISVFFCP